MKNVLVTLTGPSGSGKSTLEAMLKKLGFVNLVSHTTRQMREGEINGKSYHFVTKDKFEILSDSGAFVEEVEFNGNKYAMSKSEILKLEESSSPGVIVVEPHGKEQIVEFAKLNDIKTLKVFIDIDPMTQMSRLLERFAADASGISSVIHSNAIKWASLKRTYASRLVTMMTTERTWVADAYSEAIPNRRYDMLVSDFDRDSQNKVIEDILKSVDSAMLQV
jgi:guanylate kinase